MNRRRLLALRVAAIPTLAAAVAISETQGFFGSFRFVTLFAIFLFLVVIASFLRRRFRDFILVLSSLAFGLCVIEGTSLVLEPKSSISVSDGLYAPKPLLGWGPNRAGRYHDERVDLLTGRTVYSADYTIDEHLLRQTLSSASGSPVVFFGDSLTFGVGLNDADTLPQQFADLFDQKIKVLNFAYNGYGPSQFLRILQDDLVTSVIGPRPKLFVFLTAAWQAERTACKSDWARLAPRFVRENEQLELKGTCGDAQFVWLRDRLRPFAAYRLLVEPLILKPKDEDVELYIRILLEAVKLAEERYGARTIIPFVRSSAYLRTTRSTDDTVMGRLREGGAIVIDASLQQEEKSGVALSIPGDGHPTALANRLRAIMLKDYVEEHLAEMPLLGSR